MGEILTRLFDDEACAACCSVLGWRCIRQHVRRKLSSNDCPSCPRGTTRKFESISEWCGKCHWDQSMCQCIVNHESSGNSHANNYNTNGSFDIGFWQVNSVNWDSCSGGSPPCDVATNLQCAIKVWGWGGDSFKLWSTYQGCLDMIANGTFVAQ